MSLFKPTQEQRSRAFEDLSLNIKPEFARLAIINPKTCSPIGIDTFKEVFANEIADARYAKAQPMINKYHEMCKNSNDPAVVKQWINLNCRGMFGRRFELDLTKSPAEQINQVVKAGAEGLIGAQEVTAYCDSITKKVTLVEYDELLNKYKNLEQLVQNFINKKESSNAKDSKK